MDRSLPNLEHRFPISYRSKVFVCSWIGSSICPCAPFNGRSLTDLTHARSWSPNRTLRSLSWISHSSHDFAHSRMPWNYQKTFPPWKAVKVGVSPILHSWLRGNSGAVTIGIWMSSVVGEISVIRSSILRTKCRQMRRKSNPSLVVRYYAPVTPYSAVMGRPVTNGNDVTLTVGLRVLVHFKRRADRFELRRESWAPVESIERDGGFVEARLLVQVVERSGLQIRLWIFAVRTGRIADLVSTYRAQFSRCNHLINRSLGSKGFRFWRTTDEMTKTSRPDENIHF